MCVVNLGCFEKCCSEFVCRVVVYRWRKSNVPLTLLYPAPWWCVCHRCSAPETSRWGRCFLTGSGSITLECYGRTARSWRTCFPEDTSRFWCAPPRWPGVLTYPLTRSSSRSEHLTAGLWHCFIKHSAGIFRLGFKWFPCLWYQGTNIYDAKRGALVDLGILDVMQIFGRAGRPQFDKHGEGTIITTHEKLSHYLTLLTQQNPIESQFLQSLADNLNAEVQPHTQLCCETLRIVPHMNLLF